jgi:hypothetical protein
MTQEHKPAAALDLPAIIVGSKTGFDKYSFFTNATFAAGRSFAFTIYLKSSNAVINAFGFFIILPAAFQSYAFGFLTLST